MDINIEELVNKVKKGDWNSYLKLFLHKRDALYRRAFYITKNHHDTDDVIEDSIVKGFNSIKKIEDPSKVYSYLTRIVINNCYDLLKKNKRTTNIEDSTVFVATDTNAKTTEKVDLQRFLQQIDEEHRTVLMLRFFEDMKIEEIAEILDIPEGTVKSRIFYGLKKLKTLMGGDYREM